LAKFANVYTIFKMVRQICALYTPDNVEKKLKHESELQGSVARGRQRIQTGNKMTHIFPKRFFQWTFCVVPKE